METALGWGWGQGGLAWSWADRSPSDFPFRLQLPHLLPEGVGCQLSAALHRWVHLDVLLVVNPKKNLRNFFWPVFFRFCFLFICPFPLAGFLDSETQGHQLKYGKEIMALSTVRKNLALRHFLWATTKLQRLGPDRAFQRGVSHRYCVSNSIVNSCFSWCLLWPGLKWPLHGKHLPSRVSEGKIAEREIWREAQSTKTAFRIPSFSLHWLCRSCSESWGFLRGWSPDTPYCDRAHQTGLPPPLPPSLPHVLSVRFSGQDSVAERGDRPGRGDLGVREVADLGLSDEAAPLTSHVISFLCVSVVTPLPKFLEWELQKRSLGTGKRLFLTHVSLVESWELDHQMSDH